MCLAFEMGELTGKGGSLRTGLMTGQVDIIYINYILYKSSCTMCLLEYRSISRHSILLLFNIQEDISSSFILA